MGREDASQELIRRLRAPGLVTLAGPGGVGKTRLGLEVAAQLREEGQAVVFVALGSVSGPDAVLPALASALGTPETPLQSPFEAVVAGLVHDRVLLVLDNCEHLRASCAALAETLLGAGGTLRILATSRQRLGASGEVVWPLTPLSLPEAVPATLPEAFLDSEALRLFCERAAALRPGFVPTDDNVEAIAEICRRLDGNALAIELAAARVVALAPAEIAARLDDRFSLLGGGPSTAPARHRSLRGALEWSYDLLGLSERALLRRLSVFAANFGLDAAEAVCGGDDVEPRQVLDLLSSLVDKSLVVSHTTGGTARFRLLESVRAYAAERLEEVGTTAVLAERHATWCLALVEGGPDHPGSGRDWLERLETEQDNLQAALEWALAEQRSELALRLVRGQLRLWRRRGCFAEAHRHLELVLAATEEAPEALRAAAHHDASLAALLAGDPEGAEDHLRASLALADQGPDPRASLRTRTLSAFAATFGDDPAGVENLEHAAAQVQAAGDDALLAETRAACGQARMSRGEPGLARAHFEASLSAARAAGDASVLAASLAGLGSTELALGDYRAADGHLHESVDLATAAGDTYHEVLAATWLAELASFRGGQDEAGTHVEECLERARAMGAPYPLARSLLGVARAVLEEGDAEAAQPLFVEAAAVARGASLAHLAALALAGGGQAALAVGDVASARVRLDEALGRARRRSDKAAEALALEGCARLSRLEDDLSRATSRARQALALQAEIGDPAAIARCLETLGDLATVEDDLTVATRLLGAAESLRARHGCARPLSYREEHAATVERLRHALGEGSFDVEWHRGAALSTEAAVAYAQRQQRRRVQQPLSAWEALTLAERQVAALAARGLANRAIAQELVVSRRTVETHLQHAYAKLGIRSRQQLLQFVRNDGGTPM